ncbi:MAG: outer membrane lipoprotein-sorting protein [Flavobacteriales bacterium]|nr:outer membrane lipoprotein-sorting protein [Flavobacteriales bacterium]
MKARIILTTVVTLGILSTAVFAQDKGLEIAKKVEAADDGWGSSSNKLTMTLKNRHGQKTTRQMHGYSMEVDGDGDKSMTVFDTPADVKGTASMTFTHKTGNDDQWLYLPAIQRVKRISSSSKSGPFMGSEFAFEDLSSQEIEKYTWKYLRDEKKNGVDCHALERVPLDKNSGYKRHITWVNKDNYRVEVVDYYDRKNTLLKTLTFSEFRLYGKYWRADVMEMINHQNNKETRLQFSDVKFGIGLTDEDFSQNSLKRSK